MPNVQQSEPVRAKFMHTNLVARDREHSVHDPGLGHIAFAVSDVRSARTHVIEEEGAPIGEVVPLASPTGEQVEWCYVADPEGNGIELQKWI